MAENFIERRKEYRLPFESRTIYTDGESSATAYAVNISRGGLFIRTLDPWPINTETVLSFMLPNQPNSLCIRSKVAHVVYDRQRCEVDNGMGFQFLELNETQKSQLNLHILNEKMSYLELKKILVPDRPNLEEVDRYLKKLPTLSEADLLSLRYRVNRICTLFEPQSNPFDKQEEYQPLAS